MAAEPYTARRLYKSASHWLSEEILGSLSSTTEHSSANWGLWETREAADVV